MEAQSESTELLIWPNPNNDGKLTLTVDDLGEVIDQAVIAFMDMAGRTVYSESVGVDGYMLNTAVDLEGKLGNGIYIVSVRAGNHFYVRRLVLDR